MLNKDQLIEKNQETDVEELKAGGCPICRAWLKEAKSVHWYFELPAKKQKLGVASSSMGVMHSS